ncbi:MAG: chain-length determining protein [Synechococcaceae cyanobacterium]|nr:chain-length determining protein [Synechococcaceae cyanobacterium]
MAADGDTIHLGELVAVLRRRRRLALSVFALAFGIGGVATLVERVTAPVYVGAFQLLVTDPINVKEADRPEAALEDLAISRVGKIDTPVLIQVLRSSLLLAPIAQRNRVNLGQLSGNLQVTDVVRRAPGVLQVSLRWPDPLQGRKLLRDVAGDYLAYSLRQRQEKLRQGLAFLDEQAPALQQRVDQQEQQLAAFRERHTFVEPVANATALQAQMLQLRASLQTLVQKQAQLENLVAAVRAGRVVGQQFQIQGSSGESSGQLRQQLTDVEQQLAEARASYRATTPLVSYLIRRRQELAALLQRRELDVLETQLDDNRAQQQEVLRQARLLQGEFKQNPLLIKQYEGIQQQLAVAKENLSSYIKARENFRLEVAQRTVPWQVIVPPSFSARPVEPSLSRNLLLSVLIAAAAGLGAAFLRDRFDHVFHSSAELEEELGMPLLGVIPHLSINSQQSIDQALAEMDLYHRFAVRESLNNLYARFRLLRADKPLRLILLTSSGQAEGKTTASALFASSLADLGQKVLLVDADLRRPQLHRRLGVNNLAGFSSLLTAEHDPDLESLTDLIFRPADTLHILCAGPVPPDAAKLLSSDRCLQLCALIRQLDYDVVLFDSPPALDLSDPMLLCEHLDGLMFLVGLRRIDRFLASSGLKRIRESGVDVLGVVANQLVAAPSQPYGYGYNRYQMLSSRYQTGTDPVEGQTDGEAPPQSAASGERQHQTGLRARAARLLRWLDTV